MDYYRLLNEDVNRRLGGAHSAELALRSLDFQPLLDNVHQPGAAGASLSTAADDLAAAGATLLAVTSVTGHRFVEPLERRRDMRFIHIGDATSRALTEHGVRRPGVVATSTTLRDASLVERITRGTTPVLPSAGHRALLDEAIFGELIHGHLSDACRRLFTTVIDRLLADGADGILLACTELSIIRARLDVRLPVLDATALHCSALLNASVGGS